MLAVEVSSGAKEWCNPGHAAGGMLTTAGNLVFYTDQTGTFHAMNATTGESLRTFNVGVTTTGPITFMLDGKQYVVQPVGGVPGWGIEERHLDRGGMLVAFSR